VLADLPLLLPLVELVEVLSLLPSPLLLRHMMSSSLPL
jgi:hypothetical protein